MSFFPATINILLPSSPRPFERRGHFFPERSKVLTLQECLFSLMRDQEHSLTIFEHSRHFKEIDSSCLSFSNNKTAMIGTIKTFSSFYHKQRTSFLV